MLFVSSACHWYRLVDELADHVHEPAVLAPAVELHRAISRPGRHFVTERRIIRKLFERIGER